MPSPGTTRKQPSPPTPGPSPTPASHSSTPAQSTSSAFDQALRDLRQPSSAFPTISPRWLLGAAATVVAGAVACAWLALCLLYWQGSWQLLYHPKAAITRIPASAGLGFESVHFAATETGTTQLTGWWIPNPAARVTILYLHGADGNLSDTVNTLAALHDAGLGVFAIDYRGYGQSIPARPNEKQLRQDAEWALTWLTLTRNIPAKSIVVYGSNLGANLAAELASDHSELAGVILDQPLQNPMSAVLEDKRSRLVPAHWLAQDRYDLTAASTRLSVASLWLFPQSKLAIPPEAYRETPAKKTSAWLKSPATADPHFTETLSRWLDDLNTPK